MQLAVSTDLALRIVMRLAVLKTDETATTAALSEQLKVRYSHAAKVVTALHRMGLVDTRRGRAGGLWLTNEGKQASVGSIVRVLEGDREVVDCDGVNPCPLRHGCRLRAALRNAQGAFFASLDAVQVSDLVASPARALLLALSPAPTA